jgi:hypothetical protein
MNESEKLVARSFRIRKVAFDKLKEIAGRDKKSVNILVNDIVEQFVDYEDTALKTKCIHIGPSVLRFLTQSVPREKIIEFARTYARDSVEGGFVLKEYPNMSKEDLMTEVKIYSKYNSMRVVETSHDSKKIVIIVHDVGLNHSLFFANYIQVLFESIGVKTEYSADEAAVVLTFCE